MKPLKLYLVYEAPKAHCRQTYHVICQFVVATTAAAAVRKAVATRGEHPYPQDWQRVKAIEALDGKALFL